MNGLESPFNSPFGIHQLFFMATSQPKPHEGFQWKGTSSETLPAKREKKSFIYREMGDLPVYINARFGNRATRH